MICSLLILGMKSRDLLWSDGIGVALYDGDSGCTGGCLIVGSSSSIMNLLILHRRLRKLAARAMVSVAVSNLGNRVSFMWCPRARGCQWYLSPA